MVRRRHTRRDVVLVELLESFLLLARLVSTHRQFPQLTVPLHHVDYLANIEIKFGQLSIDELQSGVA